MRGQTQALTTVLVTTVIVSAAASTYVWGKPLIDKREGQARADKMERNAQELSQAVVSTARSGSGKTTEFRMNIPEGAVVVDEDEDYIQVETSISNAPYSTKWTNLVGSSDLNTSYSESPDPANSEATLAPVGVRKEKNGDQVRYRIDPRNVEAGSGTIQRIDIQAVGDNRGTGRLSLQISNQGDSTDATYEVDGEQYVLERTLLEVRIES